MTTHKLTCGPLFERAVEAGLSRIPADDADSRRLVFGVGFFAGLCEKVYLGACLGAMVRPEPLVLPRVFSAYESIASVYGLVIRTLDVAILEPEPQVEVWAIRQDGGTAFDYLRTLQINGRAWHSTRADLCGVRAEDVDLEFHLRRSR